MKPSLTCLMATSYAQRQSNVCSASLPSRSVLLLLAIDCRLRCVLTIRTRLQIRQLGDHQSVNTAENYASLLWREVKFRFKRDHVVCSRDGVQGIEVGELTCVCVQWFGIFTADIPGRVYMTRPQRVVVLCATCFTSLAVGAFLFSNEPFRVSRLLQTGFLSALAMLPPSVLLPFLFHKVRLVWHRLSCVCAVPVPAPNTAATGQPLLLAHPACTTQRCATVARRHVRGRERRVPPWPRVESWPRGASRWPYHCATTSTRVVQGHVYQTAWPEGAVPGAGAWCRA